MDGDCGASATQADMSEPPRLPDERLQGPAKLLNSQHSVCMLLLVDGRHMIVQGDATTWLQSVDRFTGETIRDAMSQVKIGTEAQEKFERKVRLSITDGAGYNLRAERHSCGPEWARLHLLCDVHVIAGIHSKVFSIVDKTVSSMIGTSLSLQGAGTMSLFRIALRRVLARDLVLVYQAPDAEAQAFRTLVLDTFLGNDFGKASVRVALGRCASGDWRRRGRFEYLATGQETKQSVLQLLYTHLVPALCGHTPNTFPRSRWTGAEKAIADLGLLACVHGLLFSVYDEFLRANFGTQGGVRKQSGTHESHGPLEGTVCAEHSAGSTTAAGTHAEANQAHRGVAARWLGAGIADMELVLMATVLQPMMRRMTLEIQMGSSVWMTRQQAALIRVLQDSMSIREFMKRSTWPLLAAAQGGLDQQCLEDIVQIQSPDRYLAWPAEWKSVRVRNMLFRTISRQAASVKELLVCKHRRFPHKLFLLVADPDMEHEILSSCASSRCSYTESFLAAFGNDLSSRDALLELTMVVMTARTSTISLESSNASVRRRLVALSIQTRMPRVEAVSAEFVLAKVRRRQHERKYPAGHKLHWFRVKKHAQVKPPKRRRGGGGAWRAFTSSRCKGQGPANFAELAIEYRGQSERTRSGFAEIGALATAAHRHGASSSFGPSAKATVES